MCQQSQEIPPQGFDGYIVLDEDVMKLVGSVVEKLFYKELEE